MTIPTEVLNACRRGDRKAQYELYRAVFPVLMGICIRYKRDRDEAASTLNQGFLKICTQLEKWRAEEVPFEAWARRIMINTVIDEFRRSKNERELMQSIDPTDLPRTEKASTANEAENWFSAEYILQMIRKLPPVSQRVFNLFVHDGYSHDEIGQLLGITEGTSKWHLNAARTRLKEMLSTHGIF